MDDKVKAVLEAYHARMRDEEKTTRAPRRQVPAIGATRSCSRWDRRQAG